MRTVTLKPSAKINLTLRVGAPRADGFHEVRTLLQSVAVHDTLRVTPRRGPFVLAARSPGVPQDRTNLVWRAADLLWQSLGRPGDARDAHVRLEKGIPAGAGLGGGSADAAAALVALNTIWNGRRSRRDLIQLAAQLGADVPFFLLGGTACGLGRGDEIYPVDDVRTMGVVVLKPSFSVLTSEAYQWIDDDRARGIPEASAGPSGALETGWPTGPLTLVNDLQPPVARRHPGIEEMVSALRREGARAALMTGSGSAVFGVFPDGHASKAARRLARADWLVLVTRTLNRREAARRFGLRPV